MNSKSVLVVLFLALVVLDSCVARDCWSNGRSCQDGGCFRSGGSCGTVARRPGGAPVCRCVYGRGRSGGRRRRG